MGRWHSNIEESHAEVVIALEVLHEQARSVGFQVHWTMTKVQSFGSAPDETVRTVHVRGEINDILENCTYLDSGV